MSLRHDSLATRLGERSGRNLWRLWVEDTGYERLARNDFGPGAAFSVKRRPGVGLVLSRELVGSCHVSSRRARGVLSYEAADLHTFFGGPEVRVRVHVRSIVVTPMLRVHNVARSATERWLIRGNDLQTPMGSQPLRTERPLRTARRAAVIEAWLEEANLVYATELIGNEKPGKVVIHGEPVIQTVAAQFLTAAGYASTGEPGQFER